jgi:phage terminase large subunit-like protein
VIRTQRIPGRLERLWRERHDRDLALTRERPGATAVAVKRPAGGEAISYHPDGFFYDEARGERVVFFLETYCRHHKGEWGGLPLLLEDWQKDVIRQIFGWIRPDGTRRFRTAYVEIPRKNGKSEIAAGIGLYLTVADGEEGAEVYASATKKDQARIVWSAADAMVTKSPELKRFIRQLKSNLSVPRTSSKFEPLGADSKLLDGLNPHGNIVDELHAHKDRGVWDVLDTAMGARRQPLTVAITTAGAYDPESIGWEIHEYAVKVLEEVIVDDSFFAFIAAADDAPDGSEFHFTEEAQRQANPNYGVSVKPDYLERQAAKAKLQPGFLNEYLRLHLNQWTRTQNRWLNLERWAQCEPSLVHGRATALEREQALLGRPCWGGLDLSAKLDLTALVLVFPNDLGGIDLLPRFWIPEGTLAMYASKGQRFYDAWVRDGWLLKTDGDVIDYDFIEAEIDKLAKLYQVQELAFDAWGATQVTTRLAAAGLSMVEFGQGFKSMNAPSKEFEALIVARKVRHAGHPVLRWCVSNAVTATDPAGNIKPNKAHSKAKIDGVVATIMGIGRYIVSPLRKSGAYDDGAGFKQL